jgi:hypothetical protein
MVGSVDSPVHFLFLPLHSFVVAPLEPADPGPDGYRLSTSLLRPSPRVFR